MIRIITMRQSRGVLGMRHLDALVCGGGPTGGALACALPSSLRVGVVDVRPLVPQRKRGGGGEGKGGGGEEGPDLRVLALSPASRQALAEGGVWERVEDSGRVAPFYRMHVWDARGPGALSFSAADADAEQLGYVVENSLLTDAIYDRLGELDNVTILEPDEIADVAKQTDPMDPSPLSVTLKSGEELTTSLLLGCDGAASPTRRLMGLNRRYGWSYNAKAVVCSVQFGESEFCSTAFQRFLANGPVALLPCLDNYGSIVWSTTPGHADALVSMDDETFVAELRRAFTARHGEFTAEDPGVPHIERIVGPKASFPLQIAQNSSYVANRFALVGDAAHTVHPLAGQGFNLAMADIACLTKRVAEAVANGEDIGSHAVLKDYQKRRFLENSFSLAGIDALEKIFRVDFKPFAVARGLGMAVVDKTPLKGLFARIAMGKM